MGAGQRMNNNRFLYFEGTFIVDFVKSEQDFLVFIL